MRQIRSGGSQQHAERHYWGWLARTTRLELLILLLLPHKQQQPSAPAR